MYIPTIPVVVIRNRSLMRQLLLLQYWVNLLQIGATINNYGLFVTNLRNYYCYRDLLPMLRSRYFVLKISKPLCGTKVLSPLSLIVLDNFVRLKFSCFGLRFCNSSCMIMQHRISMTRNKITRSFIFHENRKKKDLKMCFIKILVPFPEEMRDLKLNMFSEKRLKYNTFFAFVFHLKCC